VLSILVIDKLLLLSKIPIECYYPKDLINVRKLYKNDNGYKSFTQVMKKTFNKNNKKIYYWIFDNDKDIIKLDKYKNVSSFDKSKYIMNMLTEIFDIYLNLLKNKIKNNLDSNNNLSITKIDNTFNILIRNIMILI
jgi:hypothetical protein